MSWMTRLRFKAKMALLVGVFSAGFAVFGVVTHQTLALIKVTGPVYQQISDIKNLLADILPPPEYAIESYLNVLQLAETNDPAERQRLIEIGQRLQNDFVTRHDYWGKTLPDGPIKTAILETAYEPAMDFYEARNTQLIPALAVNDQQKVAEVMAILAGHYQRHRTAIDKLVELANARDKEIEAEASSIVAWRSSLLIGLGLGIIVLCGGLGTLMARSVVGSITGILRSIERLAKGDLTTRCDTSPDEVGEMGRSLNAFAAKLDETLGQVSRLVLVLGETSRELTAASQTMSASGEETASQARTVSEAATKVTGTLQSLSASTEEMAAAIKELASGAAGAAERTNHALTVADNVESIAQQLKKGSLEADEAISAVSSIAEQSANLSQAAATQATKAREAGKGFEAVASEVKTLAHETSHASAEISDLLQGLRDAGGNLGSTDAAGKIEQAVRAISTVARQTNLLALNAIIEARRAIGAAEAFGSVASQVKDLAKSTVSVTEAVSAKLSVIQGGTGDAARGVSEMRALVAELNDFSKSIAVAVDGQATTTSGMVAHVKGAAEHADEIAANIAGVAAAAGDTATVATKTHTASSELTDLAGKLAEQLEQFQLQGQAAAPTQARAVTSTPLKRAA